MAGAHRGHRQWQRLERQFRILSISFVVCLTKDEGDAAQQAVIAFRQDFRDFIVVGGDGTHHEFVNGIMGLASHDRASVQYALFPAGTGNDFARHFKLPGEVNQWIKYLNRAVATPIDVGRIDITNKAPIYFINEAGLGLEAAVIHRLSVKPSKSRSNLRYLIEAIRTIFSFAGIRVRLAGDASNSELHLWNMTVANCRFLGGGFQLAPEASPLDGQLDLSIISKTSRWRVISSILYFFNGKVAQLSYTKHLQSSRVLVEPLGDSEVLIEVDGEIRGSLPAEFCIMEQAINFYIPLNYLK
ncbi:MAG: YegS/Rv2252/BmrU family lipid kinase [Saprospiraceae bacterium]|nr:YegS/Rv2252/BmrU family lipid kinase [Saprospiraceae bacterium]